MALGLPLEVFTLTSAFVPVMSHFLSISITKLMPTMNATCSSMKRRLAWSLGA